MKNLFSIQNNFRKAYSMIEMSLLIIIMLERLQIMRSVLERQAYYLEIHGMI